MARARMLQSFGGLESHMDDVLRGHGVRRGYDYWWEDGLNTTGATAANKIMSILDASGQFGPTRYDPRTAKIHFGVHPQFRGVSGPCRDEGGRFARCPGRGKKVGDG